MTQRTLSEDLELVPVAMLVVDDCGRAVYSNGSWSELSGLSRDDSCGEGWLGVLTDEGRRELVHAAKEVAGTGRPATSDHTLRRESGSRWARWWISRRPVDGNEAVVMAVADVHDDHDLRADLYHRATHDQLTGLLNKSHFVETTERALRRNERTGRHIGVLYVDLDNFKEVNDQGGHALGDEVLVAVAARLRNAVRSCDAVARMGGDEFAVLCEDLADPDELGIVASRIETATQEHVEVAGRRLLVRASVGSATAHGDSTTATALLDRADGEMYRVKGDQRGGGGFRSYIPEVAAPTVEGPAAVRPGKTVPADDPLLQAVLGIRDGIEAIRALLDRLLSSDVRIIEIRSPAHSRN